MNAKTIADVLDMLELDFPGFIPQQPGMRERMMRRLAQMDASDDIAIEACKSISKNWKSYKNPSIRDIIHAIEREKESLRGREQISESYKEARTLRDGYGDAYLAMHSKPSKAVCESCHEDYIPRGIHPDNPFLRHVHFSQAELDRDPALELAIVEAKRVTAHPLESAASRRSPEAWARMFASLRDKLAAKMAPKVETA